MKRWAFCMIGMLSVACQGAEEPDEPKAINAAVSWVEVGRGSVERTILAYGKVEFAADRQRTLAFVKPGQVASLLVVAGQTVKKGDTLLLMAGVPRGSPQVQQALVEVQFAERELARVRRLVEEKLATNQDLESAEKQLAASKAGLAALGGGGGSSWSLKAAMDGVVARVLVQRGEQVQAGQPGIVLASSDSMTVRAGFEVEDLAVLTQGLTARLSPVYGAKETSPALANLSTLHRVVDPTTQLVEGLLHVANPPAWMASGLAVRVSVILETRTDVVRVPRAALVTKGEARGVFEVDGGHAHFRQLTLGIEDGDLVEVKQGLSAGAKVVTTGRSSLSDGMAVRRVDAGAS